MVTTLSSTRKPSTKKLKNTNMKSMKCLPSMSSFLPVKARLKKLSSAQLSTRELSRDHTISRPSTAELSSTLSLRNSLLFASPLETSKTRSPPNSESLNALSTISSTDTLFSPKRKEKSSHTSSTPLLLCLNSSSFSPVYLLTLPVSRLKTPSRTKLLRPSLR